MIPCRVDMGRATVRREALPTVGEVQPEYRTVVLLATGFFAGVVLGSVPLGVLLFALGAILFAVRGYLNTGDKAVAGTLIFVALVAIVYFLGP